MHGDSKAREYVVRLLRATGLLQTYDNLKFHACVAAARSENRAFAAEFPHFTLPPLDLMYDAYAHVRYRIYHDSGRRHAAYLVDLALKFADSPIRSALEWGCGPARVLRHIPSELGSHVVEITGTDYNAATIDWCKRASPALRFVENRLEPPLLLPGNSFDFAYALSVFMHLSGPLHTAWRDELLRVVRPGGLLIATFHGDWYRNYHLLPDEQRTYDEGKLVVRGRVREGRKWFAAFHSPAYVHAQFRQGWDIVNQAPSPLPGSIEQDVWVFRKPLHNRPQQAHA